MTTLDDNIALYNRFLQALNAADYKVIEEVIDPKFEDHHPGLEVHGLESYQAALKSAHKALQLEGELEEIIAVDNKVITRVQLTGRHVGTIMNAHPTGKLQPGMNSSNVIGPSEIGSDPSASARNASTSFTWKARCRATPGYCGPSFFVSNARSSDVANSSR